MAELLVLGGDADGNLGDRAIVEAMCGSFRALSPRLQITVVSRNAERARHRCGARAVPPGPPGFFALCRSVRRSSLVIVGGGGLFQDDDSLVKMPYWALRVLLVRLLGRPVVGYALGVGPLNSRIGQWSARLAFSLMEKVTVRDERAQEVAQGLSRRPVEVVPDPAVNLVPVPASAARVRLAAAGVPLDRGPIVGVALRRWFPPRRRLVPHRVAYALGLAEPRGGADGERLLSLIAAVLDEVVMSHDAHILFLPTYNLKHEADDDLCREVLRRMKRPAGTVLVLDDPALYMACCGQLAALLGGRMHPIILSAAMGTPVVGLAYNPKFHGFLGLLGELGNAVDVIEFVRNGDPGALAHLLQAALARGQGPAERASDLATRVGAFDACLMSALA